MSGAFMFVIISWVSMVILPLFLILLFRKTGDYFKGQEGMYSFGSEIRDRYAYLRKDVIKYAEFIEDMIPIYIGAICALFLVGTFLFAAFG